MLPIPTRNGILGHQFNKKTSLLFHAIHSPLYLQYLKKTILFSGFKNPYKKSTKQENSNAERKNSGKKPDKN
jgi:hypothetical protein